VNDLINAIFPDVYSMLHIQLLFVNIKDQDIRHNNIITLRLHLILFH